MAGRSHHRHQDFHLHRRFPSAITQSNPGSLDRLIERPMASLVTFFKRDSSDCNSDSSSSVCQKPTDSQNVSLPVALAVCIPVVLAILVFIFLHRRHLKKLRIEEANDPHKSLDFGWDPNATPRKGKNKGNKKGPEMAVTDGGTEKNGRPRGLSMDMDIGSPYVLPPGLSGSRESLHSMTRTIHTHDDRYRPATTYSANDTKSLHSYKNTRKVGDDSSSDAGSTSIRRGPGDDMKQNLLVNAQRMSRSLPPTSRSPVPQISVPEAAKGAPPKAIPSNPQTAGLSPNFPLLDSRDSYMSKDGADLRKSNNYLGAYIHSRDQSTDVLNQKIEYATPKELSSTPSSAPQHISDRRSPPATDTITQQPQPQPEVQGSRPPTTGSVSSASRPPRKQSLRASEQGRYENFIDDASDFGDGVKVTPPSPHHSQSEPQDMSYRSSEAYMPPIDEYTLGAENANGLGFDVNRLSMGFRPLPPDDPTDNPEQRANRIRSFYKEYFDESKPGPTQMATKYYEDYDQQYLGDGAIFDPATGQFVTAAAAGPYQEHRGRPYAEPYGRRAMTPPPRAPPRFRRPHASTLSGSSRVMSPGPRAFSSASGRYGPPPHGVPKKNLPPPMPLNVLPTPHMLKDDSFALFNSMDFAPPTSTKDRQAGRPESPRGGLRPYSPMVPAHMPLASSFDDLAAMPSPHLLRKSGTFTALDFAPPPRFRSNETASDSGSIRSNRSAMSAAAAHSIRAGAYRVSRIPKEVVGTKQDIVESLRPQWDLNR